MTGICKLNGFNVGNYRHYFSIVRVEDAIFSRRNGSRGAIILGFSVVLRLFGRELFGPSKNPGK
jgi:hypothetical protein